MRSQVGARLNQTGLQGQYKVSNALLLHFSLGIHQLVSFEIFLNESQYVPLHLFLLFRQFPPLGMQHLTNIFLIMGVKVMGVSSSHAFFWIVKYILLELKLCII